MNFRSSVEQIFMAGVESVLPDKMIRNQMSVNGSTLSIGHLSFSLDRIEKIYVIGAGKAGALMASEIEAILGGRITEGHVVVKYGSSAKLKYTNITEAGHPVPDTNGFKATEEISKIASKANEDDLVICLLSGGASSLLADYPEGSSPEEMIKVNHLLVRSGANIYEMNAVRKHLSKIKGGQLAKTVYPATLVSLILSDVIDDPLDVIASGPTVPDATTFNDALSILDKYQLTSSIPPAVMEYLREGARGKCPETPKAKEVFFNRAHNLLTGSNKTALQTSSDEALKLRFNPVIVNSRMQGDSVKVSETLVEIALKYQSDRTQKKPVCLLFGGETTLKVTGNGLGGRNQHLALNAALLLKDKPGITLLSAGTDGNDGPTNAAGAVVDADTIPFALSKNIDPIKHLREFDSYNFFKNAGGHIITGPTMTNVMDMIIVIVE